MALERSVSRTKRPSEPLDAAVEKVPRAEAPEKEVKGWGSAKKVALLAVCAVALPLLVLLLGTHDASPSGAWTKDAKASVGREFKKDRLLGGLLVPGFDEQSCLSRYQSALYRRSMSRSPSPSPYLVQRLRRHEAMQRKCGPGTESYRSAAEQLKSGGHGKRAMNTTGCNYLVLISYRGLGNRMLAMASAFLYAVLTDRVLLIDGGRDIADLFCEPFPETSWLLPLDFPLESFRNLSGDAPQTYGNLVQNGVISGNGGRTSSSPPPSYVYVHLDHGCSYHDKLFYCDDHRRFLRRVPWLVMRTDSYFAPGLFLNPAYEEELGVLFPRKDAVFNLLSQYLFHPANHVWGLITRFHRAYLADKDEILGIQVRVFDGDEPFVHILEQILACTSRERLLPGVSAQEPVLPMKSARSKAVLMTGLSSWYYENIREMYWRSAAAGGEVVSVFQPSHEEHQQSEKRAHDMKALAEMYLLSTSDAIVTSGWSTFGYVAHGLGGLAPWVMFKPENRTAPDPPCRRAASMEPCFHAPPFYDCRAGHGADTGKLVPHVGHCEDMSWGLKLVDRSEW